MTSHEIRKGFLKFFEDRGHRIVPSAPVIPHGDPTLLFTNAGMNQFKDVFLGTGKREYVRAADTQKCIRVSGKHNDLEEVGRDTYHHTFFEMLGNWSFGDYYKREAIGWAWELLTSVWGLEKNRLYATVFETDDEAAELWRSETDINPSHVLRFGRKDNFWEMGDTGPCGPCSEIHFDLTADRSGGYLVNAGDARVMEIWNLVFIQHNRNGQGELEDLPAKHVDTGMGFERACALLQGKSSNYDTDVFMPIIDAIARATGVAYEAEADRVAMRVIADHIRMLTFAIADGAIPGNDGRGYVLRRILRRAARFGRNLRMRDPFIHTIADAVVAAMGDAFPDLPAKRSHVARVIAAEEESFNATLDRGLEIFENVLERMGHSRVFPGEDAFKLYDTYGFPLDLTQMMASERGVQVDVSGFTSLMEKQRARSRKVSLAGDTQESTPSEGVTDLVRLKEDARHFEAPGTQTEFVGYGALEAGTPLIAARDNLAVLASSPFYAESGGQMGDTGSLRIGDQSWRVLDTQRGITSNVVILDRRIDGYVQQQVHATVDRDRRRDIQRNHSATHLVHEALRRVLGSHVHQQGSLVAPDRLRFDFPHFGKITPEEIRAIEDMVNGKITERVAVETDADLPIEKARTIPNVKMFFGEKYGDIVRVVIMDENYSVEFCGGTHVANTADIGPFKIISETGIASGVRRIEAVTGEGVRRFINDQLVHIADTDERLARLIEETESLERELRGAGAEVTPMTRPSLGRVTIEPADDTGAALRRVEEAQTARAQALEQIGITARELRKTLSRQRVATSDIDGLLATAATVDGVKVVASRMEAGDMDEMKRIGDALRDKLGSGVGVLGTVIDGKVALVCVVTDDLVKAKRVQAGTVVGALAKLVGGGGGGRPHLATAGGKDVDKLDDALQQTKNIVAGMLRPRS
jgi:alanyl-tRNA synthetase